MTKTSVVLNFDEQDAPITRFITGPKRKKFLENPLLVHPQVGRSLRSTRKLPPPDHRYGIKNEHDKEDAGQGNFEPILFTP